MRTPNPLFLRPAVLGFLALGALACGGGGGGSSTPAPTVTITLAPSSQSLPTRGTVTFVPTVANATNPAVTWSLLEGAAAGTLTQGGVYTAPAVISGNSATFHAVATLTADASRTATATITVNAHTYSGSWTATGALVTARYFHTATLLPSGSVLAAGGFGANPYPALASMELYDPATGTWSATGSLATARGAHRAALLGNGKVLLCGGGGSAVLASAELYDPATGTVSPTGSMNGVRSHFALVPMADGRVLAAGGAGADGKAIASAEIYDPATGAWTAIASLPKRMRSNGGILLPTGKVLVTGGYDEGDFAITQVCLFDASAGTWTVAGNLLTLRYLPEFHLLPGSTKVMVLGSTTYGEVFDYAAGTSVATAAFDSSVAALCNWQASVLLDSGRVLGTGFGPSFLVAGTRCFTADPAGATWTATGSLGTARMAHRAVVLKDYRVLVLGGENAVVTGACELYN